MKHLTILVPNGQNNLSSIVGSYKVFKKANEYWKQRNKTEIFEIQLAGISSQVDFYEGLFMVNPHTEVTAIKKTDLIIIPSLNYDFHNSLSANQSITSWIREQHKKGAAVASICTGAFLLASTGLLEGKSCSTHWRAADAFRAMFPEVKLQPGKLITDENGIYTNGGAYSFLHLLLYLVEKYYDREAAIYCSKIFQIDIDRDSQSVFTIFSAQKSHHDALVLKAQEHIEQNIHDSFSIQQLADDLAISRRNLDRRFFKATGYTPVEYYQRAKVEIAKKQFESTRKHINEVMYEIGYSDQKAFREMFRRITGLSPLAYRSRYNKFV